MNNTLKKLTRAIASDSSDPWRGTVVHAYRSCMKPREDPNWSSCKMQCFQEIVVQKIKPLFLFIKELLCMNMDLKTVLKCKITEFQTYKSKHN